MRLTQNDHFFFIILQEYIQNEQSTIKHDLKKKPIIFASFKKFSQHLLASEA